MKVQAFLLMAIVILGSVVSSIKCEDVEELWRKLAVKLKYDVDINRVVRSAALLQ